MDDTSASGTGGSSSSDNVGGQSNTGGAGQVASGGGDTNVGGTSQTVSTGGNVSATGGAGLLNTGGASSLVGTGGNQTTSTGGNQTVSTGGSPTVSTGGSPTVATGGSPTVATGGSPTVSTGGTSAVNNSPIIDAFATCDDQIESNGGRSGKWYYFADTDYNATHAFGDPGTKWSDHGCAAWIILGCTGTACAYAGLGFQLEQGNPYDLSRYAGISVAFEGGNDVYFVVKTSDGGYFGTWLSGTSGTQTRNADFATLGMMNNSAVTSLDTRLITEMQFTVGKSLALNAGFGLAIHSVSLR